MKQEEILVEAMLRAKSKGWKYPWDDALGKDSMPLEWWFDRNRYRQIIFDHDFAKAFWGEQPFCIDCERAHSGKSDCDTGTNTMVPEYQVRLRQMVIKEEPLKYLEGFLN